MKSYCLVLPSLNTGGAERQALSLAQQLKGYANIRVLCIEPLENINYPFEVESLALSISKDKNKIIRVLSKLKVYLSLALLLRKSSDEIIIYNPSIIKFIPIFYIVGVHVSIREMNKSFFTMYSTFILKLCKSVSTNTPSVKFYLEEKGVSTALFLNSTSPVSNACFTRDSKKIMVVSNIVRHKDIGTIIDAFIDEDVELNIFGEIVDVKYYDEIKNSSLSCVANIIFHGKVSQDILSEYYETSSVFVHASRIEGTSNGIIDAIKYRLPVLVANTTENSYLVDDLDCFVFDVGSAYSLKKKYKALKNKDTGKYTEFLKDRVSIKFSSANIERMAKFYGQEI